MNRLSNVMLTLALLVGGGTVAGCGAKNATPEIDETTTDPDVLFDAGVKLLRSPDRDGKIDYNAAYDAFKRSATNGGGAKAEYNAGWVAQKLGRDSDAETHYRAAVAADPNYKTALLALADMLSEAERPDEAASIYRDYVNNNPEDNEMLNNLATVLIAAGRYDEAITEVRKVLLTDPNNVATYRTLSQAYFQKGELKMSQLCAEKAKTLKDGDPGIYNNMGLTYLKQGDEPAAIAEFQTAIKLDPDNPEANMNLGYVALNSGDFPLALGCFKAVVNKDPGNVDALLGLAVAQRGTKDLEGAARTYDTLIDIVPASNRLAYFNAATLHEKYTKDYKKAQKYLDAFIDGNAGNLSPSDEVFDRKKRVEESQAAEEARKKEEDDRKKRAEELKKKQLAQLDNLKTSLAAFNKLIKSASCPAVVEMDMLGDFQMIAEQAQVVIDAEELDMAGDMITMIDQFTPMVNELVPFCGGSTGGDEGGDDAGGEDAGGDDAPAPEEAPAEGGDEAPAEEAPAEGGE